MNDRDLMFLPAHRLLDMMASGEISSREVTQAALNRISELDPLLNAFVTVDAGGAMRSAAAADDSKARGDDLAPLHGLPIGIKDLDATRGIRTTLGSELFRDFVPDTDSVVVERLRNAGTVILGKTNTPEFGGAADTYTSVFPRCNNPWDLARTSGGSSGGSAAAVAAGLCPVALGSDGGGSIRLPSAWCGVFGFKATHGRIPHVSVGGHPTVNLSVTDGPIARHVEDAALFLEVISGHDRRDPGSLQSPVPEYRAALGRGVSGMRIAYSVSLGFAEVATPIRGAILEAAQVFDAMGAHVEETNLSIDPHPFEIFWPLWSAGVAARYGSLYDDHAADLMPYTRSAIEYGRSRSATDYARALLAVQMLRLEVDRVFADHDLLVVPVTSVSAWPHLDPPTEIEGHEIGAEYAGIRYGAIPFPQGFSLTGHPCASVPCGFDDHGLPIGMQLIGPQQDEPAVLAAADAFQVARPWQDRMPPVS